MLWHLLGCIAIGSGGHGMHVNSKFKTSIKICQHKSSVTSVMIDLCEINVPHIILVYGGR